MAVGFECGRVPLDRPLDLAALTPPLVERRVGGDAVDPGRQGRAPLERVALLEDGHENVLHDFLGVGVIARDSVREAEHAARVLLHQLLERPDGLGDHGRTFSSSVTKAEQFTRATCRSAKRLSRATPGRSTNDTSERSRLTAAPDSSALSATRRSSSTQAPLISPSSLRESVPSFASWRSIFSMSLRRSDIASRVPRARQSETIRKSLKTEAAGYATGWRATNLRGRLRALVGELRDSGVGAPDTELFDAASEGIRMEAQDPGSPPRALDDPPGLLERGVHV